MHVCLGYGCVDCVEEGGEGEAGGERDVARWGEGEGERARAGYRVEVRDRGSEVTW